jgi:lipid A ethanolaminephosphotransferase
MFRRRSNALLDAIQARGRERTASSSFNNADVRGMLRMLARNSAIWYAPDQAHAGRGSMLLPFFGEPAMTNTATVRLARLSGAAVVPLFAQRLPGAEGYLLRFEPALTDLPSGDVDADQRRLVDILERFVRECPEQYLWTHRKFKGRGPGLPDAYKRSPSAARVATPLTLKQRLAVPGLIVGVALFIATLQNGPLWRAAADATVLDEHRAAILWSLFAIVFCTLAFVLALIPGRRPLKFVATGLLVVGAACNYFMTQYGIVIDESMVRNTVETTVLEATPFLGGAFVWHLTFFGLAPAVLVGLIPLPRERWSHALLGRLAVALASLAMLIVSLYVNFGAVTFFGHQHRAVRLLMNPGYPVYATARYFAGDDEAPVRAPLPARLAAAAPNRRPALVVFVMGETARADRFSWNGYDRDTNRYTREHDVINFPDVHSCGTSTAESVPCVFSHLGRAGFSHEAAAKHESWFGALGRLGVDVFWRDNSTGCKDVCDPAHFVELANETAAEHCDSTGCFDEILLENFDALLADRSRDHFIVLHQRGSHGPAYHITVPQAHKEYLPECDLPNLRNCTRDAINNAYDNTILYTDYFLSRVIETLEARSGDFATAMVYVSDHGESLGENGIYLHGFPYALAPEEQKRVPMLFWASQDFYTDRLNATPDCAREAAQRPTSHDALMHTILPWFGVEAQAYDEHLDLFATCRRPAASLTLTRDATPLRTAAAPPGSG